MVEVNIDNYLDKMGEFRVRGPTINKVLKNLIMLSKEPSSKNLGEDIGKIRKYKRKVKLKHVLSVLRKLGQEHLIEKIFFDENIFEQPRSQLRVKLPKSVNEDLSYLVGAILGDGHVSKKGYQISIAYSKDLPEFGDTIRKIVRRQFMKKVLDQELERGMSTFIESKIIHTFFKDVIGLTPGEKKVVSIPKILKNNSQLMTSFVSGFFDTDGTIHNRKDKKTPAIGISQKSREVLDEIQEFLESRHIPSKIYIDRKTGVHNLSIRKRRSVIKFCKLVESRNPSKLSKINEFIQSIDN